MRQRYYSFIFNLMRKDELEALKYAVYGNFLPDDVIDIILRQNVLDRTVNMGVLFQA